MEEITVLIVEDDFRVAEINRQYVEQAAGYIVQKIVYSGREALDYLEDSEYLPDIVLLDVYIPDVDGMDLMWKIRQAYHEIDIMIVSAEREAQSISAAFRGGVFDYIVKPVDHERFSKSLDNYREYRNLSKAKKEWEQSDIDGLTRNLQIQGGLDSSGASLPKGIDAITLDKMIELFSVMGMEAVTANEVSSALGISRSTARRYLEYLVSLKKMETKLIYGTVGRPQRKYVLS